MKNITTNLWLLLTIKKIFTNVPLTEAINICTGKLYELKKPTISKKKSKHLM